MTLPNQNYALDDPFPRGQFPPTALGDYHRLVGLFPSHYFAGSSLTDLARGLLLTENNTATHDQLVAKTLRDFPTNAAGVQWSHAYEALGTSDSLSMPAADSIDLGFGSFIIHLTGKFTIPVSGLVGIFANWDSNIGLRLRVDLNGKLALAWNIAAGVDIGTAITTDDWEDIVIKGVRVPGQTGTAQVATTRFESVTGSIPANDDFQSASPFQLFTGPTGIGALGQIMTLVISTGAQCDDKPAQWIARESAKEKWWDDARKTVSTGVR